jgi:dienelactone hydrolase
MLKFRLSLIIVVALIAASCSDDSSDTSPPTTTTTLAPPTSVAPETTTTTEAPVQTVRYDERGPHAVGVTTISLSDREVEVWYPAEPADVEGLERETYSSLEILPQAIQDLLSDIATPIVTDAYRDVPSAEGGPWPLTIYSHGAGGYRKVSTFNNTHLASWGFVVASVDHLERGLLARNGLLDLPDRPGGSAADVSLTIDMLVAADDAILGGLVDGEQVAIMGHSAGGGTVLGTAATDERIDTLIFWASSGDPDSADLPTLPFQIVIADLDIAFSADRVRDYYDALEGPRQLIVLDNAGHNSFTDACGPIWDLGGLASIGEALGLPANLLELGENGCVPDAGFTEPAEFLKLLNHLTLAHLLDVFEIEDVGDALTSTLDTEFAGLVESNDIAG